MRSRGLAKEGGGREGTAPCCFKDSGATKMNVLDLDLIEAQKLQLLGTTA